jgi:hypothetical protein
MNTELLIDEIAAELDGEDDILDSAVGLTDLDVYTGSGGPVSDSYC